MDNRVTTPFSYCPSTAFLPVQPHCANAKRNRCPDDWRWPPGRHRTMWIRLSSKTWNPVTFPWMKQSMWLRIVHSGDWCLQLALHTPRGACHKRRRLKELFKPGSVTTKHIWQFVWTAARRSCGTLLDQWHPAALPSHLGTLPDHTQTDRKSYTLI